MTGFCLERRTDETWREVVDRYARPQGLHEECLELYDDAVKNSRDPAIAAWDALYEWDCLPVGSLGGDHA